MEESLFKPLKDYLTKVPAVRYLIWTGVNDEGFWWVKFQIDIGHLYCSIYAGGWNAGAFSGATALFWGVAVHFLHVFIFSRGRLRSFEYHFIVTLA
ncbi:hypothetical protein OCK74_13455 [Chitinophagaceae bacterium LB-8]|uniref:Uncharacterized protein n=1 Tax=Paraflavisolibacter caeni TaxID=2982496 RepID=A0A9X2XP73_9BACT|nr:hypothetical protein [Paraflavisolibacter caeni]MCU7550124.1 hypothetical protein [Paraflavisolibacter caeni]